MAINKSAHNYVAERFRLTTDEFSAQHLVQPQSVRKQYSATGSYHGVVPLRLPNRRLLWPADSIERIVSSVEAGVEGA